MVTVTNQQSERIELMSDRQIMKEITNSILRMFPNGEAPIDILVPRWQQNPLFRGSYSNWPIGAFDKHHMNIRAPLSSGQNSDKPRLWFAGEATSTEYYGYLHGAWIEGKSVAKQVVQCLKSKCPSYNSFEFVTSCDPQDTPNLRFLRQYR
jgi:polyamine oxidase